MKRLIIFGTGDLAQIAAEYFPCDYGYEIAAFTVDRDHMDKTELLGIPIVAFDGVSFLYPPSNHDMHIAVVYQDMNRLRAKKCQKAKDMGYTLISYISPHAFVSKSAKIGEHAFIFEGNVIQSFVEIGDNCILWSGNHIGHHSKIGIDNFISSHVVVSGHCEIGSNCFIGVNTALANNTVIGKDSWISHGSLLQGNIPPNSFVRNPVSEITPLNEDILNRALKRARR